MQPRAMGAFEAVSYIRRFMRKYRDRDRFAQLLDELDSLIDDIASGVAVDFRARLRNPTGQRTGPHSHRGLEGLLFHGQFACAG